MEIRNYTEKDKNIVQEIFSKYWTDRDFLNELGEELDKGVCKFYLAVTDSEVVGVAGIRSAPEYLRAYAETKNPAELYIIASRLQNKGIGATLGQKVIEEARKSHFTEIECYSPESHSSSWKFYEKLGFVRHGIIINPSKRLFQGQRNNCERAFSLAG